MAEIYTYALGMIENRGFAVIVKASDAIVKAAKVELTGYEEIVGSYVTNVVQRCGSGPGCRVCRGGNLISAHAILQPYTNVDKVLS